LRRLRRWINARRWTRAKFLGIPDENMTPAHLPVRLKSGVLERNRIGDRHFNIAGPHSGEGKSDEPKVLE
jgi:hypothetical protein